MEIFIVENDKEFRNMWIEILAEDLKHQVESCESLEGKRIEEYASEIHNKHFGLALVDRRAISDLNENDTSGERLALQLCQLGTPAALVTAFRPSDARIFELLRKGWLTGLIDKTLGIDVLVACVQQYTFSRRFPNGFVKFIFVDDDKNRIKTSKLWSLIREKLKTEENSLEDEEFQSLFRSLVSPCAIEVELYPIQGGQSGAAIVRAEVSCGDGIVEELAIKYGDKKVIKSEEIRYDRFVGPLPDGVAAQLRWRAETENLAALAYSWVNDSIEDAILFKDLDSAEHPHLTWRCRRDVISRLFSVSLNRWYEIYRKRGAADVDTSQSLLEYYRGRGGLWYEPLDLEELNQLPPEMPEELTVKLVKDSWDFGSYGQLMNPVKWAMEGKGSELKLNRQAPIHGDLHVANLFVLPDNSPRLIDFGKTGFGHIFRDFAALEVSIRLTCVGDTCLEALKQAENTICKMKSLGQHIDYRSFLENHEKKGCLESHKDIREAVRTTMEIRRAALDAAGGQNDEESMQEYLFAVVLHMLRYAKGTADENKKTKDDRKDIRIWHALYGAACAATAANRIEQNSL